jgi:serine protease 16
MQPQVEMEEYNEVVADSLSAVDVGGSQQCLDVVVNGHKTIGDMLNTQEGRTELESMFNICVPGSLNDKKNQEQFAGDGVVYFPVQSNDPACTTPFCNIESICSYITGPELATQTDVQKLASLSSAMSGGSCKLVSYDTMIKGMSNPKNPERSWLYQTCTEWGFYQTCPIGSR